MGYPGWVGLTHKKSDQVTSQPVFVSGQKNGVRVIFFRVGFGLQILTSFAMSNTSSFLLLLSFV